MLDRSCAHNLPTRGIVSAFGLTLLNQKELTSFVVSVVNNATYGSPSLGTSGGRDMGNSKLKRKLCIVPINGKSRVRKRAMGAIVVMVIMVRSSDGGIETY